MAHIELNPEVHENHYFTSENSFSEALHEAVAFVERVEAEEGGIVSFTTAEFLQDDVVDDNGFHAHLYQVFVTVVW